MEIVIGIEITCEDRVNLPELLSCELAVADEVLTADELECKLPCPFVKNVLESVGSNSVYAGPLPDCIESFSSVFFRSTAPLCALCEHKVCISYAEYREVGVNETVGLGCAAVVVDIGELGALVAPPVNSEITGMSLPYPV